MCPLVHLRSRTPTIREQYSRPTTRCQTAVTDAEWRLIEPHLPPPKTAARLADARERQRHLLRHARRHRLAPSALGRSAMEHGRSLVRGVARRRHVREDQPRPGHGRARAGRARGQPVGGKHRRPKVGRRPQPERQDHRGRPRGYHAGKKINRRKRHAPVGPKATPKGRYTDRRGLLLEPHPASIQDRDSGGRLLDASRPFIPFIERVFADAGYDHARVTMATTIVVEIVRKRPDQIGFAALRRRSLDRRVLLRMDQPKP